MDVLTHLLSGAVLGMFNRAANYSVPAGSRSGSVKIEELSADRGIRQTALIAAVLPDIDIVAMLAGPFAYFRYHRGPTHSILGIIALSAVLAYVMARFYPVLTKKRLFLWALAGTSIHVGLDLLTAYSTFLLWPFSGRPFISGILRFSDRNGWYFMGSFFLLSLIAKRIRPLRFKPVYFAMAAVILYGGYIGARAWVRYDLMAGLLDHYSITEPVPVLFTSGPRGVENWGYVLDWEGEFISGSVSYPEGLVSESTRFSKDHDLRLEKKAMSSHIARFVRGFSPFIYIKTEATDNGYIVSLGDLRFGSAPRLRAEVLLDLDGAMVGDAYLGFRGQARQGLPVR